MKIISFVSTLSLPCCDRTRPTPTHHSHVRRSIDHKTATKKFVMIGLSTLNWFQASLLCRLDSLTELQPPTMTRICHPDFIVRDSEITTERMALSLLLDGIMKASAHYSRGRLPTVNCSYCVFKIAIIFGGCQSFSWTLPSIAEHKLPYWDQRRWKWWPRL